MTSLRPLLFASALVVGLTRPVFAADGVVMTMKTTSSGTEITQTMQIEKTRIRAEMVGAGGLTQVVIFDAGKQVLYLIDNSRKSYIEMTKPDAERLGAAMQGMMAQMQGMMANMPPEQRAKMEAMMGGRGGAAQRTTYSRVGAGKSGKWACDRYEGFKGQTKVAEICTVDPKVLGLAAADFAATEQLAEYFQAVMPQAGDQLTMFGKSEVHGFSGVAVRTVTTMAGSTTTMELTEVRRQMIPDSAFVLPAGYEKRSLDLGMGMPGRGR